jgi:sugar phosphate isomerase/epimerase
MPGMRIAVPLANLRMPWRRAVQTAAQLGAKAVEIDARGEIRPQELSQTAVRQIRKVLDDYDLRVSAVGFFTRRGYNVLSDLDRRIQATRQAMEMAQKLGAAAVVNHVGRVPEQREGPEWDLLLETLRDLGQYGQRVGVTLASRTGSESGESLAVVIDALPEGAIGVDLDPGSLLVNGFSASEATRRLARHIVAVHARDAVHDLAQRRGVEVALGDGSVDFPEILGILEQVGYRGYLTVQRESATEPLPELRREIDYLRSLAG